MSNPLPNVSRETSDQLRAYADLVRKWNPKINLVSKSSVNKFWERHILDSVQVYNIADSSGHWVDLGSGGGLPGIVVAILNDTEQKYTVSLVESDQRKCAFLRTAVRELGLNATIYIDRIEMLPPQDADVLSARALSDLPQLLEFAERHLKPEGVAIFPKGETWKSEIARAESEWSFTWGCTFGTSNRYSAVLKIKDIIRV